MKLAQSPHIPATGELPSLRDIPWLVTYGLRGLWELIKARLVFARLNVSDIPKRNANSKSRARGDGALPEVKTARISYVLPRISDRLPWRSDCLVQAIAAQNWLAASGVAGEIQIGVENPQDGQFGAHAWLLCDGEVVTGGDNSQYQLLLGDSQSAADSDAVC